MLKLEVYFSIYIFSSLQLLSCSHLIVNYKNNGDEVIKETIDSNPIQNIISINFQLFDGTLVEQFIDYENELAIYKLRYLPERVLNEQGIREFCFITAFKKSNMISPEDISKLRQKNPNVIRHSEEFVATSFYEIDMKLSKDHLDFLSPYPRQLCSSAQHIYAIESELQDMLEADATSIKHHKSLLPSTSNHCSYLTSGEWCLCQVRVCIGWYPCDLKYCKGKDFSNFMVTYRCGIKACDKCHDFQFLERFDLCPSSARQGYNADDVSLMFS